MKFSKIDAYKGLGIALLMIMAWGGSLGIFLNLDVANLHPAGIVLAMLWQTFLYTGLFITAHDAMHGTLFPLNRKINNFIGSLAVRLYALFSYRKLHAKHWEHHRHPASEDDPDFHDGEHPQFWRWYLHFFIGYVSWQQLAGMAIAYNVLQYGFSISAINLILFWAGPAVLSTFQLFYFGTYLPHRDEGEGYHDKHRARSNDYPVWLSFLTCFHFGYHWEHHDAPHVPWWRLPREREKRTAQRAEG